MGIRTCLASAFVLLLAACATAPPPEPEAPVQAADPRIEALLEEVNTALANAPGTWPRGLTVSIPSVEDTGPQLIFEAAFAVPETFGRKAQDFTVYVSCDEADLPACAAKVVDAAQALSRLKTQSP